MTAWFLTCVKWFLTCVKWFLTCVNSLSSVAGRKKPLKVLTANTVKKKYRPFIQNSACRSLRSQMLRCRECRSNTTEHQCRFFAFRRYVIITVVKLSSLRMPEIRFGRKRTKSCNLAFSKKVEFWTKFNKKWPTACWKMSNSFTFIGLLQLGLF